MPEAMYIAGILISGYVALCALVLFAFFKALAANNKDPRMASVVFIVSLAGAIFCGVKATLLIIK